MAWPGDRVQQKVIAKLSLRLSLNSPSNIWHSSNKICHKNDRVTEREREEKKRKKESERASEFDAKWYGNWRKQGTTGWISFIGFARSVNVHNMLAWFTPSSMDCRVFFRLSLLGAYRFTVFRAHLCQKLHTKVVFKHFDRDSYVLYIYIYIIYYHITNIIFPLNCHEKSHVAQSMALIKPFTVLVAPSTCPIFARWRETHFPHGMGCYDGDMMEILL